MKRHTVVLSDIHLCELEPTNGDWMRYRQREQAPDEAIASMLGALLAEIGRAAADDGEPHALTLALNGDIFDFDAPRVAAGESVIHDDPRDDAHSVPLIEATLRDHPVFVDAIAKVLTAGHTVVFISGNHDAQVTLPAVRDVIRERVLDAASSRSSEPRASLASRLLFRAWFYLTEDGVLLEHGGQYDPFCVFHYPTSPYHKDTAHIQPTLGSLASRLMTSRMGYFNPNVDFTYELTAFGYIAHWYRYYLGSHRAILLPWIGGALSSFFRLMAARDEGSPERLARFVAEAARETGASEAKIIEHARLFASPIEISDPHHLARELWVDRLALALGSAVFAAVWLAASPWLALHPASRLVALAPLAAFLVYERLTHKKLARDRWVRVDARAPEVARVHGARAVVFGHTHHPHGYTTMGVFVGNSGSWASAFHDVACTQPVFPSRPMIWLKSGDGRLTGGLVLWTGSAFEPREQGPFYDRWTP